MVEICHSYSYLLQSSIRTNFMVFLVFADGYRSASEACDRGAFAVNEWHSFHMSTACWRAASSRCGTQLCNSVTHIFTE